jgi:hypothetical protein
VCVFSCLCACSCSKFYVLCFFLFFFKTISFLSYFSLSYLYYFCPLRSRWPEAAPRTFDSLHHRLGHGQRGHSSQISLTVSVRRIACELAPISSVASTAKIEINQLKNAHFFVIVHFSKRWLLVF